MEPRYKATAWKTRREDHPGEFYYLVSFDDRGLAQAVAAVAATGEVMEWAELPGTGQHLAISAPEAEVRAGFAADAEAALIWRPCRASRCLRYPIRKVGASEGSVYVDLQGVVWNSLKTSGPGGQSPTPSESCNLGQIDAAHRDRRDAHHC